MNGTATRRKKPIDTRLTWESPSESVAVVHVPARREKTWKQSILLSSDRHWDNPASDWNMQARHLNEARERGAIIVDNGDLFCAMQGKFDKRSSKKDIRQMHAEGEYLDLLVDTATDWFAPWADIFAVIGTGNHESAITDRHETNLISRLVANLNKRGGNIADIGFAGFVKFQFHVEDNPYSQAVVLHLDHGYGGGGPVTRDTIQHQRRQNYLPDADIIMSGHTHDAWSMFVARKRLTQGNVIRLDEILHIKTPTYKDDFKRGRGGWHVCTGKPPKPLGAYWLNFTWHPTKERFVFDVERAN